MKLRHRNGEFQVITNGVVTLRTLDYGTAIVHLGLLEVDDTAAPVEVDSHIDDDFDLLGEINE